MCPHHSSTAASIHPPLPLLLSALSLADSVVCHAWMAATYLVGPSLTLVRSKNRENREVGIDRVNRWHSSDYALPEVVAQGGAEALLSALPAAQPASRLTILELLVRMAPMGDAKARLARTNAASHATASCTAEAFGADRHSFDRCHTLANELGRALSE